MADVEAQNSGSGPGNIFCSLLLFCLRYLIQLHHFLCTICKNVITSNKTQIYL